MNVAIIFKLMHLFCYNIYKQQKLTWDRLWRGNPPCFSPVVICKGLGEKRIIRCFAGQHAIPNPFLLYCFNINKAKHFILCLVVRDSWPLFEPQRLKGLIGWLLSPNFCFRNVKVFRWLSLSPNSARNESLTSLWSLPELTNKCPPHIRLAVKQKMLDWRQLLSTPCSRNPLV